MPDDGGPNNHGAMRPRTFLFWGEALANPAFAWLAFFVNFHAHGLNAMSDRSEPPSDRVIIMVCLCVCMCACSLPVTGQACTCVERSMLFDNLRVSEV